MGRPLQSLMPGIFPLYCLRIFTYLGQHLPSLFNIDLKMSLVPFLLQATAWIIVSFPLGGAALIFFHYVPFWPLSLNV
jgi:hypothetical protein